MRGRPSSASVPLSHPYAARPIHYERLSFTRLGAPATFVIATALFLAHTPFTTCCRRVARVDVLSRVYAFCLWLWSSSFRWKYIRRSERYKSQYSATMGLQDTYILSESLGTSSTTQPWRSSTSSSPSPQPCSPTVGCPVCSRMHIN